jgi:hypothetical protein
MKNANVFIDVDLTLVDANGKLLAGARESLERRGVLLLAGSSQRWSPTTCLTGRLKPRVATFFCGLPVAWNIVKKWQNFMD